MYQKKRYYLVNSEQESGGDYRQSSQRAQSYYGTPNYTNQKNKYNYIKDVEFYAIGNISTDATDLVKNKIINLLYSQWKTGTEDNLKYIIKEYLKFTREKCKTEDEWIECKDKFV